jgi:hypothetical protein
MSRARLIKKESNAPRPEPRRRKLTKARAAKAEAPRHPSVVTAEWIKSYQRKPLNAREAFSALFAEADPQAA